MSRNWTTDPNISITFKDSSVRTITRSVTLSKCSFDIVGFSSYGPPNISTPYNSTDDFVTVNGSDVDDVEKYGYSGLYAMNALLGGGQVWWTRLLPSDAVKASIVLSVYVKEDDAIPVFERNEDGSFVLDEDGNKVPVMVKPEGEEDDPEADLIQKTIKGYRIKWVANPNTRPENVSAITTSDGWKVFPLLHFYSLYPGKAGNKFGLSIVNDFARDNEVDDGRRYRLSFYRVNASGVVESFDKTYRFSFNPEALVNKYYDLSEGLRLVYEKRDKTNDWKLREIQMDYFNKNWSKLLEHLSARFESGSELDIDILSCKDANAIEYDEILLDDASIRFDQTTVFFEGGNDGSLELGNTVQTSTGPKLVDEEHIEKTRIELLKAYYTGKIDKRVEDCRKVQTGFIVDCNYPTEVKQVLSSMMRKESGARDDLMVLYDCGITKSYDECLSMLTIVNQMIDASDFRYAIFPHCGDPVNSVKNADVKVTQTYETIYKLPKIYNQFGSFCLYAGEPRGLVETFIPDWYIDDFATQKKVKALSVNYITDYGNIAGVATSTGIPPLHVDAEETLYSEKGSVVKSFRNAVVVCDIRRLVRTLFIKYRFSNSAAQDIQKAGIELQNAILNRYPSELTFTPTLYQTEADKIDGSATCHILYEAPSTVGKWNIEIEVNRQA